MEIWKSDRLRALVPAAAYLALAVAWSWPLAIHITNRFTHDPGDPLLVTYLVWWNAHAIPFTQRWWNAPFFWPMPDALALTDHLAGVSPLTTPLQLLGASPLAACNALLLCATWWTLLATHALMRRITGSTAAAACAAVAFAFSPYRTSELGHIQIYACWWIPLSLLAILAYLEDGRRRWLAVFAASWLLQALTNGYFLFFLPLLLTAWTLVMMPGGAERRRALHVLVAFTMASCALLPVLLHYRTAQAQLGLTRSRTEMIFYSAGWKSLLSADPNLLFWHTPPPVTTEGYLFPGITVVGLLIVAAGYRVRSKVFWFGAAGACAGFWLCMGPAPAPSLASLWHPYDWLLWLPGFSGIRVPPRFFMMAAMCLALAAGVALAHIRSRVRYPRIATTIVFVGLFVDGAIGGMPLGIPPGRLPALERGSRVLGLPFENSTVTTALMYQATSGRLQVVNGYAGYIPPHADVISWALHRADPTVLTELRRGSPLYVLVASTEDQARWTAFMDSQPDAEMLGVEGGGRVYRLAPAPYARERRAMLPITDASLSSDPGWLIADLHRVQPVRGLELRTYGVLHPVPDELIVQTSIDGTIWTTVFADRPGGLLLTGALASPRVVPLTIDLQDVAARYVRLDTPAFSDCVFFAPSH